MNDINNKPTIRRVDALRQMELREDENGKRIYYAIQFFDKNGNCIYFSRAYTCGLRCDMKKNRMRGIQQVDAAGNKINHIVPVSIDYLREFNHQRIVL